MAAAAAAAAALCAAQPSVDASGKLSGKVRNSVTGEPIRKATVVLRPSTIPAGSVTMARGVQSTLSDPEGAFHFERIAPGQYTVTADRIGFLGGMRTGGRGFGRNRIIRVDPGGAVTDVVLDLVPHAVITGRVLDEDGDPMEKAFVSAGTRRQPENLSSMQTNDLGEFRISGLKPGKYIVMARLMTSFDPMARLDTAARRDSQIYTATYHPSAVEPTEAAVITLSPGQEARGIEIRMRRTRAYRVRGRVTGSTQTALLHINRPGSLLDRLAPVSINANGGFEMSGLRAGLYEFVAISRDGRTLGMAEVQVSDDIDDLSIPPVIEGSIRATLKLDPPSDQLKGEKFQVLLMRGRTSVSGGEPTAPGVETVFDKVVAGRYRVRVLGPMTAVLKSIIVDGKPADPIHVPLNVGSELTLVLTTKPGAIEGSISGFKPGESSTRVTLLRPGFEDEMFGVGADTVVADQAGKFRFQGLAPGIYQIVAADIEFNTLRDPDVLEKLSGKVAKVEIAEGAVANVSVEALAIKEAEDIEAGN